MLTQCTTQEIARPVLFVSPPELYVTCTGPNLFMDISNASISHGLRPPFSPWPLRLRDFNLHRWRWSFLSKDPAAGGFTVPVFIEGPGLSNSSGSSAGRHSLFSEDFNPPCPVSFRLLVFLMSERALVLKESWLDVFLIGAGLVIHLPLIF